MVYTKSKESVEKNIAILKQLGKIIAISKLNNTITIITSLGHAYTYQDGVVYFNPSAFSMASDRWLNVQVILMVGKRISESDLLEFFSFDRIEHDCIIYRAKDLTFHKDFEIFFTPKIEVHCEII